MSDKEYHNFKELEQHEVGNYTIDCTDRGANITIIAPHGGRIEPRTDVIAKAIAGYNLNYYGFIAERGNVKGRNMNLTSHNFDEPIALELVRKSKIVIAIHGCKDVQDKKNYGKHIFIGGLDKDLKDTLEKALLKAGLSINREKFAGKEKGNICNQGTRDKGVQFELTKSFRNDAALCEKFISTVSHCLKI